MSNKNIKKDSKQFNKMLLMDESDIGLYLLIDIFGFLALFSIMVIIEGLTIGNVSNWTWLIFLEPFIVSYLFCNFPAIKGLSKFSRGVLFNMYSIDKKLHLYSNKDLDKNFSNIFSFAKEYPQTSDRLINSNFSNYYEDLRTLNKLLHNEYMIKRIYSGDMPQELSTAINDYIERVNELEGLFIQENNKIIRNHSNSEIEKLIHVNGRLF